MDEESVNSGSDLDDYNDGEITDESNNEQNPFTDDEDLTEEKHKKDLKNLAKIDPEFFHYLQENDRELLDFAESGSEESEHENENIHQPPESLEVASDESDFDDGDADSDDHAKITFNHINLWEKSLCANKRSIQPVATVVKAFHASLLRLTGDSDTKQCSFKVDDGAIFNGVVRLCVTFLYPYVRRLLGLPENSVTVKHVEKSKSWKKLKPVFRGYIINLNKLIANVTSSDVLSVLLKHLHQMMPLVASLPTILKPLLKRLTNMWSTNSDDTVKVVAFLCILKLDVLRPEMHDNIIRMMYANYVANTKFVSPHTLPGINFMRRSLTQIFELNESISYNHAFLYIRQLAIHLRSAVTLKKKESMQAVYTWRYIASLQLWTDILCTTEEKSQMRSLLYPTIQIIIGCIKLIPTAQYTPLRFHCVQMLNKLSRETGAFIPVLPFLLEALSLLNVNVPHSKLSMKPMDFTCILRVSKSQMQENAFKDAVIEHFYQYTLEYVATESHRISIPDIVVPAVIEMKRFIKECKNANYSRKIKSLVEKIEENSKLINTERSKCGILLTDVNGIAAWEESMKSKGTPMGNFYASWIKVQQQQLARKITNTVTVSDFNVPTIKKTAVKKKLKDPSTSNELFPSDNEDDQNDDNYFNFSDNDDGSDKNEDGNEASSGDDAKKIKNKKINKKNKNKKVKRLKSTESDTNKKQRKISHKKDVISENINLSEEIDDVKDFDMAEFLS